MYKYIKRPVELKNKKLNETATDVIEYIRNKSSNNNTKNNEKEQLLNYFKRKNSVVEINKNKKASIVKKVLVEGRERPIVFEDIVVYLNKPYYNPNLINTFNQNSITNKLNTSYKNATEVIEISNYERISTL